MLWLLVGIIAIAVIWALVAAYNGKAEAKTDYMPSTENVMQPEFDEIDVPKATNWKEGAKAGVSKRFGTGGVASGVSSDPGHMATKKHDDDDWLKDAQPFEPRAVKLTLDEDTEEIGEAV